MRPGVESDNLLLGGLRTLHRPGRITQSEAQADRAAAQHLGAHIVFRDKQPAVIPDPRTAASARWAYIIAVQPLARIPMVGESWVVRALAFGVAAVPGVHHHLGNALG